MNIYALKITRHDGSTIYDTLRCSDLEKAESTVANLMGLGKREAANLPRYTRNFAYSASWQAVEVTFQESLNC